VQTSNRAEVKIYFVKKKRFYSICILGQDSSMLVFKLRQWNPEGKE
jgi:hypothetical protein